MGFASQVRRKRPGQKASWKRRASVGHHWDGDGEFAVSDVTLTPAVLAGLSDKVPGAESTMVEGGFLPGSGLAWVCASAGPCSRCQRWTWRRLIVAFEPTDARGYGSPEGLHRTFGFVFCGGCMRLPYATLRAFARDSARKTATSTIGTSPGDPVQ